MRKLLSLPGVTKSLPGAYIYHYYQLIRAQESFKCPHSNLLFWTFSNVNTSVNHFNPTSNVYPKEHPMVSVSSIRSTMRDGKLFCCVKILVIISKIALLNYV